jgi:hypothetical protein
MQMHLCATRCAQCAQQTRRESSCANTLSHQDHRHTYTRTHARTRARTHIKMRQGNDSLHDVCSNESTGSGSRPFGVRTLTAGSLKSVAEHLSRTPRDAVPTYKLQWSVCAVQPAAYNLICVVSSHATRLQCYLIQYILLFDLVEGLLNQGCTHTVLLGIFNIRLPQWTLDPQNEHSQLNEHFLNIMNIFWTLWAFVEHSPNLPQICPIWRQEHCHLKCCSVAHFHGNTPETAFPSISIKKEKLLGYLKIWNTKKTGWIVGYRYRILNIACKLPVLIINFRTSP